MGKQSLKSAKSSSAIEVLVSGIILIINHQLHGSRLCYLGTSSNIKTSMIPQPLCVYKGPFLNSVRFKRECYSSLDR